MRYDIVSDTHGYLSPALLKALEGADVIVHAGDMCSEADQRTLEQIAPVKQCLGNNDYGYAYGPFVQRDVHFFSDGLRWEVTHYRERLDLKTCDIAICGHTHRALIERHGMRTNRGPVPEGVLVMNPGSPTFPRSKGPSIGRIICHDGKVESAEIIPLPLEWPES